jgi:CheY-like chemotaxis protein
MKLLRNSSGGQKNMRAQSKMVLLVGETAGNPRQLRQWLNALGCNCQCAQSYRDARDLISSMRFDLVLSEYQLQDRTAFPLLDSLAGTSATLFFSTRVEDGSLWLKMLERGKRCVGAPILRSRDLPKALGTLLDSAVEPHEVVTAKAS